MSVPGYSPEVVFTGELESVNVRGAVLSARCTPGGNIFDRRLPAFRVQPGCNHALFSVGCGLLASDWTFTATVSDPGSPAYPYAIALSGLARVTGGVPTFTANWFAGGWAEFGADRIPILASTLPASGALSITLARYPVPDPAAGSAVTLFPGCDLRASTCQTKFSNFLNFGGHPFIPASNPSLVKLSSAVSGGKK